MLSLRQIRSVVAVTEEGSFTRAARRENATQSGLSQHIATVEADLGVRLFDRTSEGVVATAAGRRFYGYALEALRALDAATTETRAAGSALSGNVRAGLMPTFTRAALAPALDRVTRDHPDINVQVVEGYSGALTDMVRAGDLDFAMVPATGEETGLTMSRLAQDQEMLVGGPQSGLTHGAPVRLADLPPLKLILPTRNNIRRARLEAYAAAQGVRLERILEMDAMMGTLGLVACSDWVTVLPALICAPDADGVERRVCPIIDPPLTSDFVVIEPARRALTPAARHFLEEIRDEVTRLVRA